MKGPKHATSMNEEREAEAGARDVDQWLDRYGVEEANKSARDVAANERRRRTREEFARMEEMSERLYEEAERKIKADKIKEAELFNEQIKARTLRDWEDWVLLNTAPGPGHATDRTRRTTTAFEARAVALAGGPGKDHHAPVHHRADGR